MSAWHVAERAEWATTAGHGIAGDTLGQLRPDATLEVYRGWRCVETILRRAAPFRNWLPPPDGLRARLECSKCHPMHGGVFRLKFRKDGRPGMTTEPIWSFYPIPYISGRSFPSIRSAAAALFCKGSGRKPKAIRKRRAFTDLAVTPVADDETFTRKRNVKQHSVRKSAALSTR